MKLHKLSIKNYKSLKDIDFINFDDLTTIIGENDSGKTSIIEFILSKEEIVILAKYLDKDKKLIIKNI